MSVTVQLNGESRDLVEGATVAAAIALLDVDRATRGVAVAVDREVIPRGAWDATPLHDGATVEVVTAIQGG